MAVSQTDGDPMMLKINMGAGGRVLPGYFNIDITPREGIDLVADARSVPLPNGCAEEILAVHLFEHFYRWDVDAVLVEWRRLLCIRGLLVLELPNIVKCCHNVIDEVMKGGKDPDQLGMWGLYGDPRTKDPYMSHKWGWSPKTLSALLVQHGFDEAYEKPTVFHPAGRTQRDMHIEARKR